MPRKPKDPISKTVRAALRVPPLIELKPEISRELDQYLETQLDLAIRKRNKIMPRIEKWRKTIRGERPKGRVRSGASNLSVPLTVWARTAVRARLTESLLENKPLVSIDPVPGRATPDQERSNQTRANSIARFLSAQILNPRALNGREVITRLAAEVVDFGASAMKVMPVRDTIRKVAPAQGSATPEIVPIPGRIKWEFISLLDLIYCNGYGTDTQAMPFVGQEYERTWAEIKQDAALGYYDKEAVTEVEAHFRDNKDAAKPALLQNHDVAEIYMDYDVDGDGVMEAVVIDWHLKAKKRLRVNWNPIDQGRRPILVSQFDFSDDLTQLCGQGVSEKLEGAQDEADAIHNIAIEAGKRGTAHVIALKAGTRAEEEFGGEQDILPGDTVVTEDPAADIMGVPLGDPNAALAAIQIEEHTRMYVTRILGLDESKLGNVESGKRVTAAVGMATLREGRMVIKAALTSMVHMINEACYMTLDLYKRWFPAKALEAALSVEEIKDLMSAVFESEADTMRDTFQIKVNAQDAAISEETRKQEMLIINQALFPFYDRLQQMVLTLADPTLPPNARKPLLMIIERMERGIEALLNTVESIPNPEELMVRVGELSQSLTEAPDTEDVVPDPLEDEGAGDLGAGVF